MCGVFPELFLTRIFLLLILELGLPETKQRQLEILTSLFRNRVDTKQNSTLDIAVDVIGVQIAPGANTLRSPDLAEHVIFIFKKNKGLSIFKF